MVAFDYSDYKVKAITYDEESITLHCGHEENGNADIAFWEVNMISGLKRLKWRNVNKIEKTESEGKRYYEVFFKDCGEILKIECSYIVGTY